MKVFVAMFMLFVMLDQLHGQVEKEEKSLEGFFEPFRSPSKIEEELPQERDDRRRSIFFLGRCHKVKSDSCDCMCNDIPTVERDCSDVSKEQRNGTVKDEDEDEDEDEDLAIFKAFHNKSKTNQGEHPQGRYEDEDYRSSEHYRRSSSIEEELPQERYEDDDLRFFVPLFYCDIVKSGRCVCRCTQLIEFGRECPDVSSKRVNATRKDEDDEDDFSNRFNRFFNGFHNKSKTNQDGHPQERDEDEDNRSGLVDETLEKGTGDDLSFNAEEVKVRESVRNSAQDLTAKEQGRILGPAYERQKEQEDKSRAENDINVEEKGRSSFSGVNL